MKDSCILKILRGVTNNQYFEEFVVQDYKSLNIISALMEIRKNPVNIDGKRVSPVVWEQACLEEVCGSCSMLINGKPRQACSTLLKDVVRNGKVEIAPFSKFPLIRDLVVDRTKMFEDLKRVKAWVPMEGYVVKEFEKRVSQNKQEAMYVESTCMTCGCCLEACPQVNDRSSFVGASAINQVKLFNSHSSGLKRFRLFDMMRKGGIGECGNSQNCVQVCPKKIPLTQSIAKVGGEVSSMAFKNWFSLKEDL